MKKQGQTGQMERCKKVENLGFKNKEPEDCRRGKKENFENDGKTKH